MPHNVDLLKSALKRHRGLSKSNQYLVCLPDIPGSTLSGADRDILCKATKVPGIQNMSHNRAIGMEIEKVAWGYAVQDMDLTFHVTQDQKIREYFALWSRLAVDHNANTIGYKKDYQKEIKILTKYYDTEIIGSRAWSSEIILEDSFPTTINAIELNNEIDGLMDLNVQISYTKWRTRYK